MTRLFGAVAIMMVATACGSSAESMGHVHTVAVADGQIVVGTHYGLWQVSENDDPVRVSDVAWDVMGFAQGDAAWLASGHPAPDQRAPADLGLQVSTDGGRTWSGRSLVGDVDFHRLAASGDIVAGINSRDGRIFISDDQGATWRANDPLPANDLAVTDNGVLIVGPKQWWVERGGVLQEETVALPEVATVFLEEDSAWAATMDGGIWWAPRWQGPWERIANVPGVASWIGAYDQTIALVVGDEVLISRDKAATFVPAILQ
jgi:hypothetical protein